MESLGLRIVVKGSIGQSRLLVVDGRELRFSGLVLRVESRVPPFSGGTGVPQRNPLGPRRRPILKVLVGS